MAHAGVMVDFMSRYIRNVEYRAWFLLLSPSRLWISLVSLSLSGRHKWLKWKRAFKLIPTRAFCWLPSWRPNILHSNKRNQPILFFVLIPLTDKSRHVQNHFLICLRDIENTSAVAFLCSSFLESVFLLAFDVVHGHIASNRCAIRWMPCHFIRKFHPFPFFAFVFISFIFFRPHSVPIVAPHSMILDDLTIDSIFANKKSSSVSRIGEYVEKIKLKNGERTCE